MSVFLSGFYDIKEAWNITNNLYKKANNYDHKTTKQKTE